MVSLFFDGFSESNAEDRKLKIALGCDHGGFNLKKELVQLIEQAGHVSIDLGCDSEESVDYPEFADKVCLAIKDGRCARGILICGTGIGMSMAANRYRHIRAALCYEAVSARLSRAHNDANILCLGARVLGISVALNIAQVWLETDFSEGRHLRRINMLG